MSASRRCYPPSRHQSAASYRISTIHSTYIDELLQNVTEELHSGLDLQIGVICLHVGRNHGQVESIVAHSVVRPDKSNVDIIVTAQLLLRDYNLTAIYGSRRPWDDMVHQTDASYNLGALLHLPWQALRIRGIAYHNRRLSHLLSVAHSYDLSII